jgi:hypothetical protein
MPCTNQPFGIHFLDDKADKQIDEIEQPRHLRCCFAIGY